MSEKMEAKAFDPAAYFFALILAPVVCTVLTAIIVFPVYALYFGYAIYLVGGAPLLFFLVLTQAPEFPIYALAGLVFNLVLNLLLLIALSLGAELDFLQFTLPFGMIFGPLWIGCAGVLYRRFTRGSFRLSTMPAADHQDR
jgi:hypothetical protein